MNYKDSKLYKFFRVICIISIVLVAVTAVMMAFGNDAAILWFFIGCILMAIGGAATAQIKYRYQVYTEGDYTLLDRVSDFILGIRDFFLKKGVVGTVAAVLLTVSVLGSFFCAVRAATAAYEYSGAKNAGYQYNLSEAERYRTLASTAKEDGDERYENYCNEMAEKHLKESESYYSVAEKMKPVKEERLKELYAALAVNTATALFYTGAVLYRKKRSGDKEH